MIKTILIDDEKNSLEVLELLLERNCPDVDIIASCTDGVDGIQKIRKLKPDLVFLDIEMPHKNGFDVLMETREIPYEVIFITAYDRFAVKAFKVSALDYLLKPIDHKELVAAIEKAKAKKGSASLDEKIKSLLEHLHPAQEKKSERVALPAGDTVRFTDPSEIIRCESDSNYTHVFLVDGKKITLTKTLKEVERILEGLGFFRVHQSHLINMQHIGQMLKNDGSVIMKDGSHIAISRKHREAFLASFRKL